MNPTRDRRCDVCHQDRPNVEWLNLYPAKPEREEDGPKACPVCVGDGRHMRSKALLLQAWPKGYLELPGITTTGGYHYTPRGWITPAHRAGDAALPLETLTHARQLGDLLPRVDPAETSTWACLKYDLARARREDLVHGNPDFSFMPKDGKWWGEMWELRNANNGMTVQFRGLDTTDRAFALVLARIQVRLDPEVARMVVY